MGSEMCIRDSLGEHKVENETIISEKDFVCLKSKSCESNFPNMRSSWIVDSGCTAHMTFDKTLFETYEDLTDATVEMGTKATTEVAARGSITLSMQGGSSFEVRKLKNVLHMPSFEYSLLSVSALDKNGIQTTFC